jgi:hypothetical protein
LATPKIPKGFCPMECRHEEHCSYTTKYKSSWVFIKNFQFEISDGHSDRSLNIKIYENHGLKIYIAIVFMEMKYRVLSFFKYRESLDILEPYILSFIAVSALIFANELQELINDI